MKVKYKAKDIIVKPISARDARRLVTNLHYSKKFINNSSLNFGVFLNEKCEGVMQFGSPMDKRKVLNHVKGTAWNGMLELNRMAFSEKLPKNSESRAIGIVMRIIKKSYPHIKWILSFADATQCGDGTIYRASGFVLTGINKNKTLYLFPSGDIIAGMTIEGCWHSEVIKKQCNFVGIPHKPRTRTEWRNFGAKPLPGFQLRYIFFIDKSFKSKLSVPIMPFSEIDKMGAGMYKSKKRVKRANSCDQQERGGSIPTRTLQ